MVFIRNIEALESRKRGFVSARSLHPSFSGFASLLKQAPEATENSPEGFSLDRLTLPKTPATIYPS
jgi:hypothetical protein